MIDVDMTVADRPAACNIGPAELARRRRSAVFVIGVVAIAAALLVLSGGPPIVRLAIFPLAAAAAVTWLQVIRRFCVAFGAASGTSVRSARPSASAIRLSGWRTGTWPCG
jgi:hypothetical protein